MGDCKRQDFFLSKSVHPLKERRGGKHPWEYRFLGERFGFCRTAACGRVLRSAERKTSKSEVLAWGDAFVTVLPPFVNAGSLPLQYGSSKENIPRRIVRLPVGKVIFALGC